jgi:hypothetical protein
MRVRTFVAFVLAMVAVQVEPVRADDSKPAEPAIIVRLKSFDGLVGDFKFLAEIAGKHEEAKQIDGIVQALPLKNGLAGTGLDTKRPFYFYAIATPDAISSHGALMIPVADEKALVSFLEDTLGNFGVTVTRGTDGIHSVSLPNMPIEVFFTVADKYAYVTARDRDALTASRRMAPAKLAAASESTVVSATLRLDRIPDMLKQMALSQFELHAAEARDKKGANETAAQTRLKMAVIDFASNRIKTLVRDGSALDVSLNVDRNTQDINWEANLTGKAGTALAKDIADLGSRSSQFASSLAPVASLSVNLKIPAELRDAAVSAIREGFEAGLKNEKDEKKRAVAKKALATFLPILEDGHINLGIGVRGNQAGQHTFAFAMKVPDGKKIEQFVKDDLASLIPANERHVVTFDATTIGGQSIHRVVPPHADAVGANEKRIVGNNPSVAFTFPADRAVLAFGADADGAVKALLEATPPKAAPPIAASVSLMKLAPLMDPTKADAIEKAAKETFANAPSGSDLITLTVQGGPALKVKWSAKALGLTFFTKVHEFDR